MRGRWTPGAIASAAPGMLRECEEPGGYVLGIWEPHGGLQCQAEEVGLYILCHGEPLSIC